MPTNTNLSFDEMWERIIILFMEDIIWLKDLN